MKVFKRNSKNWKAGFISFIEKVVQYERPSSNFAYLPQIPRPEEPPRFEVETKKVHTIYASFKEETERFNNIPAEVIRRELANGFLKKLVESNIIESESRTIGNYTEVIANFKYIK